MAPRKRTVVEPSTRVTRSSSLGTKVKTESPKKKRTKKNPPVKKSVAEIPKTDAEELQTAAVEEKVEDDGDKEKKTIIIEHCKQCNSFKTRAVQVKSGLEKGLDGGVHVILNPEKPRRGCFEIREEGENGEKFVSLLEMNRPFKPMKALDMDQVISDIIEKIK